MASERILISRHMQVTATHTVGQMIEENNRLHREIEAKNAEIEKLEYSRDRAQELYKQADEAHTRIEEQYLKQCSRIAELEGREGK